MIVTLDGRRLQRGFAAGCTLASLIEQVRDTELAGRLVVTVTLNGQRLVEDDLEAVPGRKLEEPVEVRIGFDGKHGNEKKLDAEAEPFSHG